MYRFSKNDIDKITNSLKREEVIALPTDTIYGFSCLPTSEKALSKICKLKNRDSEKSFIVLVSSKYDISKLLSVNVKQLEFIKNNTPNPLTIIAKKNDEVKLSQKFHLPTIAIRIPNDAFLQNILNKVDIMVSTSCNLNGENYINDCNEIINNFDKLDAIVVEDNQNNSISSTIIDITSEPYKIIRQGKFVPKI